MEIPGLPSNNSGGIDTQKLIQDLLEAERIPITNLEEEIEDNRDKITLWKNIENTMEKLQSASRNMYKLDNAFDTFSVSSEAPNIVYATARRGALTGDFLITVKQTASADRWMSEYVSNDYKVKKGNYTLAIGEQRITLKTDETNLSTFVEKLNKKTKNLLQLKILKKGSKAKEQVLLLESLKIGKKHNVRLSKTFKALALDLKLINYKKDTDSYNIALSTSNLEKPISNISLFFDTNTTTQSNNSAVSNEKTQLRLKPGAISSLRISDIPQRFFHSKNAVLKLSFILDSIKKEAKNSKQENKSLKENTVITPASLEDVSVEFSTVQNILAKKKSKQSTLPVLLSDINTNAILLSIDTDKVSNQSSISTEINLTQIQQGEDIVFTVVNPLNHLDMQYVEAVVFEESGAANLVPKNPISRAQNAIIEYNGIKIERETNEIADVIPGITLQLKKQSEEPVTISVSNNIEDAKNDIIYFVGRYNQLMQKLNIYSGDPERTEVLNDINFETQEEFTKAQKNVGKLSTNFGITRMISNIERIITREYPNTIDARYSSLRSIGIERNFGNGHSIAGNRYLNINETELADALETSFGAVKYLFSVDRNNDLSIDYGIAFLFYDELETYLQSNGIIQQRINALKRDTKNKEKNIERLFAELERTEANLRRKYGKMQQSLNELESIQNTLDIFNINNGQR